MRLVIFLILFISLISSSCHAMTCSGTVNGVVYDLSPLSGVDTYVIPPTGDYNYYINVCGSVQSNNCSLHGSAFVCQINKLNNEFHAILAYDDQQHTPTWAPSDINPHAGVELMFYTNGACNNVQTLWTIIDFYCPIDGTNDTIIITQTSECIYKIAYPTKTVCAAPPNCKQIINHQLYDLTPLQSYDYHIVTPTSSYYVSVCGIIETSPCNQPNMVACQVTNSPEQNHLGLAYQRYPTPTWEASPQKQGGITLTYTNGDVCNGEGTTIFDFQCDTMATNLTITVNFDTRCTYRIIFITKYACPLPPPPMPCKQTIDGVLYDLTPLQGKDVSITPSSGLYKYDIDVCGASHACSSMGSAFVCQVMKSPINQFVSVLAYSDITHTPYAEWRKSTSEQGGVTLIFTNGDECNMHTRKTIIDFQCNVTGNGTFSVIESPACTFHITFPTHVVCPTALLSDY